LRTRSRDTELGLDRLERLLLAGEAEAQLEDPALELCPSATLVCSRSDRRTEGRPALDARR
jgi:hypothetical protein